MNGDTVMKIVSDLVGHPLDDQDRDLEWTEIGIDSFSSTELLLRLEGMAGRDHAHTVETALFASTTPAELISRLSETEGIQ